MAIQKAEAIVLHGRRQGETSKIVTVYSREYGKLSLMAKGSRGVRSKYLGTLETFNHVAIVFYHKEERQMQYLSQASILQPFPKLHEQLGRISLAGIPCEIIEKSEIEHHAHPQQFQLLLDTLLALETQTSGLRNIVRAFMLQFVSGAGFEPELTRCRGCSRAETTEVNYFSLQQGNYSCGACGPIPQEGRRISGYALQLLRWFSSVPVAYAAQVQTDKTTGDELDSILFDYLVSHIEALAALKSFAHLQKLQAKLIKSVSSD